MNRILFRMASLFGSLACCASPAAAGLVVQYELASTGQTATADFSFLNSGSTLVIALAETTPAGVSSLTGGPAVLTRLGFNLPGGELAGGAVIIGPGSGSVGFGNLTTQLGAGSDISAHWGYTPGTLPQALLAQAIALNAQANSHSLAAQNFDTLAAAELARAKAGHDAANALLASNPTDPATQQEALELHKEAEQDERDALAYQQQAQAERLLATEFAAQAVAALTKYDAAPNYTFVGVLQFGATPFQTIPPAIDLLGPGGADEVQSGLLLDTSARGGLGIVNNSVILTLNLTSPLSDQQQAAFYDSLRADSLVEYGTGLFARSAAAAVPAPSALVVLVLFGGSVLGFGRRRAARFDPMSAVAE